MTLTLVDRWTARGRALCAAAFTSVALAGACARGTASSTTASMTVAKAPNQLSAADRAAGWRLLFDGRSLAGWRGLGYPDVPAAYWTVTDGTIHKIATSHVPVGADGRRPPGGDLMTEATFRDFELAWDWKISPAGNSGVKYNVSEELSTGAATDQGNAAAARRGASHAAIGFEYQVIDDDRHSDGKLPTHRSGALYDLIAPSAAKRLAPVGEWNHSVVILRGTHGEHWLNGVKVVDYDLASPEFAAALAKSKFRGIPWFAERRAGHIVLQDHGDEAFFRGIKIRELK
jgi:hypothetical protein